MNVSIQLLKRTVYSAIIIFTVVSSNKTVSAQSLSSTITISSFPSPYTGDWSSGKEKIMLTVNSGSASPQAVKISAQLERNGITVAATKASAPIVRTVAPGVTIINGADILQPSSLDFFGSDGDAVRRSGKLSDGQYHLCIKTELFAGTSKTGNEMTTACASFEIKSPSAPIPISPAIGSAFRSDAPLVFLWSNDAPSATYRLIIFKASAPDAAHAGTNDITEMTVTGNTRTWLPVNDPLVAGKEFDTLALKWQIVIAGDDAKGGQSQPVNFYLYHDKGTNANTSTTETTAPANDQAATTVVYIGPCDSIKFRTTTLQHDLDSINSLIARRNDSASAWRKRIDSLNTLMKSYADTVRKYEKIRQTIWKRIMSSPVDGISYYGPENDPEYNKAAGIINKYSKLASAIRDSIYYSGYQYRSLSWGLDSIKLQSNAATIARWISDIKKECKEYIDEMTADARELDEIEISNRRCIEKMQQTLQNALQQLQQLKNQRQSYIRDESIAELTAAIARLQHTIETASNELGKAIANRKNGEPGHLRGLSICKWAEDAERQMLYTIKTVTKSIQDEADRLERTRIEQQKLENARKAEEAKRQKEEADRKRKNEEMQSVKDHLKNTLEQMIDAIEGLGEHSKGVQFLAKLKSAVDDISSIAEFIDMLANLPQNYINLLQAYAMCLQDPNYENIQDLASAFCAYAGITGPDQMALVSQSFHNNLPGIIGKISAQDREDMRNTIHQIVDGHNAQKK